MQRLVLFVEQRHYLAVARQHGEKELAKRTVDALRLPPLSGAGEAPWTRVGGGMWRPPVFFSSRRITDVNHFFVRLTNMAPGWRPGAGQ